MRTSPFERYSPLAVSLVGGILAVVCSLGLTYASVSIVGWEQMEWPFVLLLATLCPGLIAPPIIYYQCKSLREIALQRHELAAENERLSIALGELQELSDLVLVCAWCHKVQNDSGHWEKIEAFIERNSRARITHGVCPDCQKRELEKLDEVCEQAHPKTC